MMYIIKNLTTTVLCVSVAHIATRQFNLSLWTTCCLATCLGGLSEMYFRKLRDEMYDKSEAKKEGSIVPWINPYAVTVPLSDPKITITK